MLFGSHRLADYNAVSTSTSGQGYFSYVSARSTTSQTANLTLPSGSQAGDLCVYLMLSYLSITAPVGWTLINSTSYSVSPNERTVASFYKILTSSDISAGSISGVGINGTIERRLTTFRPSSTISTVNVNGLNFANNRSSPVSGITMNSGLSNPCIVFAHYSLGPFASPTNNITFSNADGTTGTYLGNFGLAYELTAPAGSNTARSTNSVSISSTDYWATAIFALSAT